MVNLVADQSPQNRLVPELIQDDFTAGRIVQELEPLLVEGEARARMMDGLAEVGQKLHGGRDVTAISAVAGIVVETLGLAAGESAG